MKRLNGEVSPPREIGDDHATEADRDRLRVRRQKAFLETIEKAERKLQEGLELIGKAKEIAASGQSHVTAIMVEVRTLYREQVGDDYAGNQAADGKALRSLVTKHGAEEVRRRVRLYLQDRDPFLGQNGYPMALLRKRWALYSGQARPEPSRAAVDFERGDHELTDWIKDGSSR